MLSKILKYDLKWIYKEFVLLYLLTIGGGILVAILPVGSGIPFIDTLAGFAKGFLMSMIVVVMVTALKKPWTRMATTMYGDQAYLTRTLPVPVRTAFTAKVLAGLICLFTGLLVSCVAISLAYPDFWGLVADFSEMISIPVVIVAFLGILALFAEICCMLMAGFLGITIGYRQSNQHFAWSAVATVIIYLLSSASLIIIELLAALLGDKNIFYLFMTSGTIDGVSDPISGLRSFVLVAIISYFAFSAIYYGVANLILKRGADID